MLMFTYRSLLLINLVEISRLHLEELVHRDIGTESRNDDTEEEDRTPVMASSCQPSTLTSSGS